MQEPDIKKEKTYREYVLKRDAWTAQELAAAGGPMGRLIDPDTVKNVPKTREERKGVAGYAWAEENRAEVYDQNIFTALHEGKHLLKARDHRQKIPRTDQRNADDTKHKDKEHGWIEANELYNARTRKQYQEALERHQHYLKADDTEQTASSGIMAKQEYRLGARLMFDPGRGHGANQVAQSAIEAMQDEIGTYKKYRDRQSFAGRGGKEPWEYFAGKR